MDIGSIIRAAAPFLSAIFGAVTAVFAALLFTRSRRLQREAEESKHLLSTDVDSPCVNRQRWGKTASMARACYESLLNTLAMFR